MNFQSDENIGKMSLVESYSDVLATRFSNLVVFQKPYLRRFNHT